VTWSDIQTFLRARHEVLADGAATMTLLARLELEPDGIAAAQPVRVELVKAFGAAWLLLVAEIGPESTVDARAALAHNARLAIGALAIDRGVLVFRATFAVESLSEAGLARGLDAVAREAALVRRSAHAAASTALREYAVFAD
jgi:hypothetical protein